MYAEARFCESIGTWATFARPPRLRHGSGRGRQAQREPGARRRDDSEAREFIFGVVMVFAPVEVAAECTASRIEYQSHWRGRSPL